jgi:hypothetical protein
MSGFGSNGSKFGQFCEIYLSQQAGVLHVFVTFHVPLLSRGKPSTPRMGLPPRTNGLGLKPLTNDFVAPFLGFLSLHCPATFRAFLLSRRSGSGKISERDPCSEEDELSYMYVLGLNHLNDQSSLTSLADKAAADL